MLYKSKGVETLLSEKMNISTTHVNIEVVNICHYPKESQNIKVIGSLVTFPSDSLPST